MYDDEYFEYMTNIVTNEAPAEALKLIMYELRNCNSHFVLCTQALDKTPDASNIELINEHLKQYIFYSQRIISELVNDILMKRLSEFSQNKEV
jgi:hypothetical protein